MARLIFSFSVPEESEAAHLLRRWKNEGKVLSHVIQNSLEYGAREQIALQKLHDWEKRHRIMADTVLKEVFGVYADEFQFRPLDGSINPLQPLQLLRRSQKLINNRSEFVFEEGE